MLPRVHKTVVEKICIGCRGRQFRRVNRNGFLQHRVLTKLGYFPWECILCRRRIFFRDDGRRALQPAASHSPAAVPSREASQLGK